MPVTHKIIRGEGAGKYLGFARAKLARLAAECERARAPQRTRRFVVDAGMVDIEVAVKGGQHYIKIERRPCPPFLSGICELVLHKEGDAIGADVPFTPVYQIDDPDDSDPEATIDVFRRFYPSPATPAEDRAWRDEPRLAVDQSAAKQMITLCGSMFTSEMRKVVQVLQGGNVFIPYSPTFARTHGVFKSASGARWIIEISNRGVLAWRMNVCPNPILGADGEVLLEYHPVATPRPETEDALTDAIIAGAVLVLTPLGNEVQEPFNQIPFYGNCGWAFDADGHKASNVVWNFVGMEIRSYIYTITISEVDDLPSGVTVVKEMEGQLTGSILTHMKYPVAGGGLYSFDHRLGGEPTGMPGPVYCFYDGPTLVWVRRYMTLEPSSSTQILPDDKCAEKGFPSANPIHIPVYCIGQSSAPSGNLQTSQEPYFESTMGLPALASTTAGILTTYTFSQDRYLGLRFGGGAPSEPMFAVSAARDTLRHDDTLASVIVIPLGDREGFYFVEELTRSLGPDDHTYALTTANFDGPDPAITTGTCSFNGLRISVVMPGGEAQFNDDGEAVVSIRNPGAEETAGGPFRYYPGATYGDEIEMFEDSTTGPCTTLKQALREFDAASLSWVAPLRTVVSYKVMYRGSGGLQVALPEDESAGAFVPFLDSPNSQSIHAFRDAFSPKIILEEYPNAVGVVGYKSTASEYPGFPENRRVCFVGVP